ncbi:MAG: sigma-70 family RNA polymerase sigma factor [Pseudomonadota bacterium]
MFFRRHVEKELGRQIVNCRPAVWRFALSLSGRPDIADDLAQATYLRALERVHQWRQDGRLEAWLLTICRSIWLNELRAQSIRQAGCLAAAEAGRFAMGMADTETNIFASEVYAKVMELPEAQRATVELVYVEQFTYREAASILDVPIGTIMSRLATARAALRHLNDAEWPKAKGKRT